LFCLFQTVFSFFFFLEKPQITFYYILLKLQF
jgi:hypothetical protein